MQTRCSVCDKKIWRRRWFLQHTEQRVCGPICKHKLQQTGKKVQCKLCKTLVYRPAAQLAKSKYYFCSASCRAKYYNAKRTGCLHPAYTTGACTFRRELLRKQAGTCGNTRCPIMKAGIHIPRFLLEAHHLDSDRTNNNLSNGRAYCTWCHKHLTITGNLPT